MVKPIPYSEAFAKRFPETVEKQLRKDGVFDREEIKLLNPTEMAYLISDASNRKRVNEIIRLDSRNRRNVCSALWLMQPAIATKSSCPSESVSLNFKQTIHPSLLSDSRYESRLMSALKILKDTAPPSQNIFTQGPWRVVPKDQSLHFVVIPSVKELENFIDISALRRETVALTRYHPHPLTGELMITVYLTGAAIRSGICSLSVILAHELFGHVHDALIGITKQKTDTENEKLACQRAIGYAGVLRQWVRQNIRSTKDVAGILKEIDEAENEQKAFMESVSGAVIPRKK